MFGRVYHGIDDLDADDLSLCRVLVQTKFAHYARRPSATYARTGARRRAFRLGAKQSFDSSIVMPYVALHKRSEGECLYGDAAPLSAAI